MAERVKLAEKPVAARVGTYAVMALIFAALLWPVSRVAGEGFGLVEGAPLVFCWAIATVGWSERRHRRFLRG